MGRKVTIAASTLNQWALDFEGNADRILQSILEAKELGATFRTGPELEIWPKKKLCDNGNYRETRWFSSWKKDRQTEDFHLPRMISNITGQKLVPIGDAVISTLDTCIGFEICEELWCADSTHTSLALDGVEIICNGSGSYSELRKGYVIVDLVKNATMKCGGCYIFSNLRGCDGQRVYFDGVSSITLNGHILSRAKQFALEEVEVITATIDLEDIRTYRNALRSNSNLASGTPSYPRILIDYSLSPEHDTTLPSAQPLDWIFLSAEEEIAQANPRVLADLRRIIGDPEYMPKSPSELCNRASSLAAAVGSYHMNIVIDKAISAVLEIFSTVTGLFPKFAVNGGCPRQNLALQNIQARMRMVLSYLFAQLMLWARSRPGGLLVLGSANVDEALRGYMTKYDCSSADINPIGGISKTDLRRFMVFAKDKFKLPIVGDIINATPTAELEPLKDGKLAQSDEEDMGMTYTELSQFGRLRKIDNCGPYSMYCKLVHTWSNSSTPKEVAEKVKHFFRCYAINRHKMTVLTPSYHAECYSPDDNRFDHRPFLYRANWSWQFRAIDKQVEYITSIKRSGSNISVTSNKKLSDSNSKARAGVTV
ncbi:hypothetical protein NQ314_017793 [Rhamnusium bicolor]|uniref:Glutamine-dependent NAD(+) synthetase n=1 Tax=Rhamnusium bicolor TaxID=1586634 RepID=A0AAV8WRU9_9CUCU|nr:hypothetical protein NQ314_017793 [Rhamnusium bicolor]